MKKLFAFILSLLWLAAASAEEANTQKEEMTALFKTVKLQNTYKTMGENNPLFTQRFGADPGVLVWNDRMYVYTTNDIIEYDAQGNVISVDGYSTAQPG